MQRCEDGSNLRRMRETATTPQGPLGTAAVHLRVSVSKEPRDAGLLARAGTIGLAQACQRLAIARQAGVSWSGAVRGERLAEIFGIGEIASGRVFAAVPDTIAARRRVTKPFSGSGVPSWRALRTQTAFWPRNALYRSTVAWCGAFGLTGLESQVFGEVGQDGGGGHATECGFTTGPIP
jgi:hypothetical protein